jgi:hypothetical protein
MLRRLLRFFAPFLLALALCAPAVQAQTTTATEPEKTEHSTSALPYAAALLYALLVLTIICMPSRKA